MTGALYNEIDPYAADWLRNLSAEGHIAPGTVDTRSIVDLRPADVAGYRQCHFFAGIAGWSLALRLAGWPDDRPVWTGSCPCQPFSAAGLRRGFDDDRHLWPAWLRLVRECRPAVLFGEQSANAPAWLARVRDDLATLGYPMGAVPMEAASAGANHRRDRFWFVAYADGRHSGAERIQSGRQHRQQPSNRSTGTRSKLRWLECTDRRRRLVEPGALPLIDAVAGRLGRVRAYGNCIDIEAATAFIAAAMDSLPFARDAA